MTPLPDQESTIPFGAILENVTIERDTVTFEYLSDLYSCPRDVFQSAVSTKDAAPTGHSATAAAEAQPAKLHFEALSSNLEVSRAKVPGGWLLATAHGGVTFYPDPGHEWNGESLA